MARKEDLARLAILVSPVKKVSPVHVAITVIQVEQDSLVCPDALVSMETLVIVVQRVTLVVLDVLVQIKLLPNSIKISKQSLQ